MKKCPFDNTKIKKEKSSKRITQTETAHCNRETGICIISMML